MITPDMTAEQAQKVITEAHQRNMENLKKSIEAVQSALGYQLHGFLGQMFRSMEFMSMELSLLKRLEFGVRFMKFNQQDYKDVLADLDTFRKEVEVQLKAALEQIQANSPGTKPASGDAVN